MKAACEVCGTPDNVMRAQLLRQAIPGARAFELPDILPYRSPFLCDPCRGVVIDLVKLLRNLADAGDLSGIMGALTQAIQRAVLEMKNRPAPAAAAQPMP